MKKLIVLLFMSILLAFPHVTTAQSNWTITDFHSDINLEPSGTVLIEETISTDFGSLQKHGIYRDLPYVYTEGSSRHYTTITLLKVLRDGVKEPHTLEKNDANVQIKIGNSNKLITGKHKYVLTYRVTGILSSYSSYDEFYWNVTGNKWEAPIGKATASFHLPKPAILQLACYFGIEGSATTCNSLKQDTTTALFSSSQLSQGEGMTIAVGFQKNLMPILSVTRPKTFWEKLFDPANLLIFFSLSLSGIGYIIWTWWKKGRDYWTNTMPTFDPTLPGTVKPLRAHETIVVEFTPPDKLLPAEVGVLMDERADTLDITATLIDLARRGYLHITEVEKKRIFGKTDYILKKMPLEQETLAPYEKELLSRLFDEGTSISLSSLKRTFLTDLQEVKKKLYEDIVTKNLFISNPQTIRNKYLLFGALLTGLPIVVVYFTGIALESPFLIAIGSGITITGITLMFFSRKMPRRSSYGRELYKRTLGYKLFISGAEKYRQQFYEKHNLFDEILPYAIVFGLTEKFAKAMKEIGIKSSQPSWYTSTHPYNPIFFASSMNSFSQVVSSTLSSAPKSSGSGGGGFSGGGFGGGGGGSW